MSVSHKTKQILAMRSGNRCALSGCGRELSQDDESGNPVNVADVAHIAGEKQGSVRYDPDMTDNQRNHYDNLIYLCATCHRKIDAAVSGEKDYPVERLLEIKEQHERKVEEGVAREYANVGFPELEKVTQWISQVSPEPLETNFSLMPLESKIKKNDLSKRSERIIAMGLSVAGEVCSFVESLTQTDRDFPQRLKIGFLQEYYRIRKEGHVGDDLFELMCEFAQQGFRKPSMQAASHAVLVYLFEKCEVFEK